MPIIKVEIRLGAYYDSVILMQLQRSLAEQPGIIDAGVVMGTDANKEVLAQSGMMAPEAEAARFVDAEKGVADIKAALEGAKYILMERFAEDAGLLDKLRNYLKQEATLSARVVAGKEEEGAKFRDYFEHDEPLKSMPSHRALTVCGNGYRRLPSR